MSDTQHDALGMWEFGSVPSGIECADAIAKGAPVAHLVTGTVQPGKYLVVAMGDPASVEVANDIVTDAPRPSLLDSLFLADIASDVARALFDVSPSVSAGGEAIGVVETSTVASGVDAADAAVKHAHVSLASLRLADGIGGEVVVVDRDELLIPGCAGVLERPDQFLLFGVDADERPSANCAALGSRGCAGTVRRDPRAVVCGPEPPSCEIGRASWWGRV